MIAFDRRLGVDAGLYHYNVERNCLELLRPGDLFEELQSALSISMQLNDSSRPEAAILFTSLCERAMWRYRESRSWRAIVLDVGHAEQMCKRTCAALGLDLLVCHQFDAVTTANFLGIDPFLQPVLSVGLLCSMTATVAVP
jgi:SagB-type dehydrogenase family enzyme